MILYNGNFYLRADEKELIADLTRECKKTIEIIENYKKKIIDLKNYYKEEREINVQRMKRLTYLDRRLYLSFMEYLNDVNEQMIEENDNDRRELNQFFHEYEENKKAKAILKRVVKEERKFYFKRLEDVKNVIDVLAESRSLVNSMGVTPGIKILVDNISKTMINRLNYEKSTQISLLEQLGINEFKNIDKHEEEEEVFIFD